MNCPRNLNKEDCQVKKYDSKKADLLISYLCGDPKTKISCYCPTDKSFQDFDVPDRITNALRLLGEEQKINLKRYLNDFEEVTKLRDNLKTFGVAILNCPGLGFDCVLFNDFDLDMLIHNLNKTDQVIKSDFEVTRFVLSNRLKCKDCGEDERSKINQALEELNAKDSK